MVSKPLCHALIAAGLVLWFTFPLRGETLSERRERVSKMSSTEKEELKRKENRFRNLTSEDQQRLRNLDAEIAEAPDGNELREVMVRYYAWLRTLPSGRRAEILSLPPDERLLKIRELLEQQSLQRFQRYARTQVEPSDVEVIKEWMQAFIEGHEEELLESLSEQRREEVTRAPDQRGRRYILTGFFLRGEATVPFSSEEIEALTARLSDSAAEVLKKERDTPRQGLVIRSFFEAVFFSNFSRRFPPVPKEELMRFLEEEATDEQRRELEGLTAERYRREAERLYHHQQWRKKQQQGHNDPNGGRPFRGFFPGPLPESVPGRGPYHNSDGNP